MPPPDRLIVEVVVPGPVSVVEVAIPGPQGPIGPVGPQGEQGPQGIPGVSGANFLFVQNDPQSSWTIAHGLNRFPSVTLVDTAHDQIFGDVNFLDQNTVVITFSAPVSGSAFLN